MKVKIYPQPLSGTVSIPGSKSLTHRALICASLSCEETLIINPLIADDTFSTITCLRQLGVKIDIINNNIIVKGIKRLIVTDDLEILESASTLRFLIPLLSLWNDHFTIKVSPRLLQRIRTSDLQALLGLEFMLNKDSLTVKGKLNDHITLTDDITSQWISGVLFTLPYSNGSLNVNKLDNAYIIMTLEMMRKFNVIIKNDNNNLTYQRGSYLSKEVLIEGDMSTAAFFLVSAIYNNIQIKGINKDSGQGDAQIFSFINKMGLRQKPKEIELDLSLNPDLVPIIASFASLSQGITILTGLNKLKYKESNRIVSIYEALLGLGANIKIVDDQLVIVGKESLEGGNVVNGHNDHRIIMSLVAISSQIKKPFIITDCEAVNKSNPLFFQQIKSLGGIYEYQV